MPSRQLFVDFGSTYTKSVCVDMDTLEIVGKAKHPSTVDTDITEGLKACLDDIFEKTGPDKPQLSETLACSSAAGGLRIVCIGYVQDYSAKAANLAALGAGAKVVGVFSNELTSVDLNAITRLVPDIILLTGGTDGGDKKIIVHNAKQLVGIELANVHIVVAGNRSAIDDIEAVLTRSTFPFTFADNVMPEVNRLEVASCNQVIRDIFINTIIEAKGIGKAGKMVKSILMPTPTAVLSASVMLADGTDEVEGLGETLVVDVGGATTDVHSIADWKAHPGVDSHTGLPEPREKRTVEGDLGLNHNLETLLELASDRKMEIDKTDVRKLDDNQLTDLARLAVETATERHVGRLVTTYGASGQITVQYGKDLTQIKAVVGTGGPIINAKYPSRVLGGVLFNTSKAELLKPQNPCYYLDEEYILFAGGLMGNMDKSKAVQFLKKHLKPLQAG